jgi:anhydro-N-acetylmuramic acid kinase
MRVIGVMSGTSLDGLDLACVIFNRDSEGLWKWELENSNTIEIPSLFYPSIADPEILKSRDLIKLDFDFGKFIGSSIKTWISKISKKVDLISSHGHTIFHKPSEGYTFQIGNGATIYAESGIPTVCDFRTVDVSLGGEGAPLVPYGDLFLFPDYKKFLNLGGIANISIFEGRKLVEAYDVCPFNQVINFLASRKGLQMDSNGEIGKEGNILDTLLNSWNQLPYYSKSAPKSLGREWVQENFFNPYNDFTTEDLLATFYEHAKIQILRSLNLIFGGEKVLLSGGGTWNEFFLNSLRKEINDLVAIPQKEIVDFKEAIIFAFLGLLRVKGERNIFAGATGATRDNIGGALYGKVKYYE